MIINLKQIQGQKGIAEASEHIDLKQLLTQQHDILDVDKIKVHYGIEVSGDKYIVTGHGDTVARFECARCLQHFEQRLHIPFEDVFTYNEAAAEEDDDLILLSEPVVDLRPHIEEHLILGFPFIPLCKEDCQGLCAICGQDKNVELCQCKDERIDPRLEGLRVLLEDGND